MILVYDIANRELLSALTATQSLQSLILTLRDVVSIDLYVVQPTTSASGYTQQECPAGWSLKLSIKPAPTATSAADLAADALAGQGTWTLSGSGATAKYVGELDLNTAELISKVGTAPYLDCLLEVVLQDASQRNRDSAQVTVRIRADVHRPTDTIPGALSHVLQEYVNSNGAKCIRIVNSDGQTLAAFAPAGETP